MLKIHEHLALITKVDPASQSAGTVLTPAIDMSKYHRVAILLSTGVLGTNATVDFSIVGDVASGGSYATTITGKSATQVVKASGDNKAVWIEVDGNELRAQGLRYIKGKAVVGTAASIIAMYAFATEPQFGPMDDHRSADILQVID